MRRPAAAARAGMTNLDAQLLNVLWPRKPSSCPVIALSASAAACRARSSRSGPLRCSHGFLRPASWRAACTTSSCSRARAASRSGPGDRSPSARCRGPGFSPGSARLPIAITRRHRRGGHRHGHGQVPENPAAGAAGGPPAAPLNNAGKPGPSRAPAGRGVMPAGTGDASRAWPSRRSPAWLPPAARPGARRARQRHGMAGRLVLVCDLIHARTPSFRLLTVRGLPG